MIECRAVSKIYRSFNVETPALKGVSFKISDGEFVAIMGPSGSGKSTLMHILGCLDTPSQGSYFLDSQDVSRLTDEELAEIRLKKIGFVFQAFNLLPRATVLRNVELPLVYAGVSPVKRAELAQRALRDSAFPAEFWQYLSNQLSGGMMQRVAIARALVNDPKLILADEPTGNLDSQTGDVILETFAHLNSQGKTIVLITHERYIAEKAKRIIFVKDGQILEDGPSHSSRQVRTVKE